MSNTQNPAPHILIYPFRRDLRLADNPILHSLAQSVAQSHKPYTHLLPVYIFPAEQVEVSGFLATADAKSPYPEARSQVGGFWRCGVHRARWTAESVWDLKAALEGVGSGLVVRVGRAAEVVGSLMEGLQAGKVDVWMTGEEGVEEKREERAVRKAVKSRGGEFKLWQDEKYFVDDRDLPFKDINELSDVFTTFRKTVEPLRDAPRSVLPAPTTLPPLPSSVPPQHSPFTIPGSLEGIISALHKPLDASPDLPSPPKHPSNTKTAIPFSGGSKTGHARLKHLLTSGAMTTYKDTRNGMLGADFSTKLSPWLALGSLTARQVHAALLAFEDGTDPSLGAGASGYGRGENKGTGWVRFELLWRDYFRLCARKYGPALFRAAGFRADHSAQWKYDGGALRRWQEGTTGMGLIDASQRELALTGYSSNRARQNVASFLAKHLGLDWRLGAEWYESCLVDHDVASNWGNWQYTAGVGNDPREGGAGRKFNPVKQTGDYDRNGAYIKAWCEELREVQDVDAVAQCWKVPAEKRAELGLEGNVGCEQPLVKIEYRMGKGRGGGYQGGGRRGGKGDRGGRGSKGHGSGRSGFSKRDEQS